MEMDTLVQEPYYTVKEIADRLRVTRQAIYNWIDEGRLKAVKVGRALRIPESAVADFVKPAESSDRGDEQAQP